MSPTVVLRPKIIVHMQDWANVYCQTMMPLCSRGRRRTIRLYTHTIHRARGRRLEKVQRVAWEEGKGRRGNRGMQGKPRSIPAKAGDTVANPRHTRNRNREKEWLKSRDVAGLVTAALWYTGIIIRERLENLELVSRISLFALLYSRRLCTP